MLTMIWKPRDFRKAAICATVDVENSVKARVTKSMAEIIIWSVFDKFVYMLTRSWDGVALITC